MFENLDDPKRQALLMMAAGLLAPQDGRGGKGAQFAAALSNGLQGGLLGLNQARQAKRRDEVVGQETELRRAQMEQMKRAQADDEFKRSIAPQFFQSGNAPADGMGPAMPPKADLQGFGMALAQRNPDMGLPYMPKPTEPKMGFAPDGTAVDMNNLPVGKSFAPPVKPKFQDGDTREIKAGNFILSQEFRGGEWRTIGKAPMWKPDAPDKGPAAPAGFRFTPEGNLQAIPGGPADTKIGEKAEAMQKREAGALARADMVLGNVREAIKESGVTTAGPLGAISRNIPGTGAYNLNKKLDAIRSNIGFAELQAMREASPTGGALGQVAVQELNMLQSVLGSLDTAQSPAQLEKNLYAIEKHYSNWKNAVKGASQESSKGGGFKLLGREP